MDKKFGFDKSITGHIFWFSKPFLCLNSGISNFLRNLKKFIKNLKILLTKTKLKAL